MSNRLIGLLIILIFIILGLGYYFGIEKTYKEKQEIIRNTKLTTNDFIPVQKKATLTKIEVEKTKSLLALTKNEKIELEKKNKLKIKQNIGKILKINNLEDIKVQKILGDDNLFLISLSKDSFSSLNNYIFNKKRLTLININLNISVIYAKKINYYIYLATEKGIFIFKNNNLKFFGVFFDFIIHKGNYIGVIRNNDNYIKNNFNLNKNDGNLVFLYNPKKSIKRILYKPNFKIKKILLKNNKVIIKSDDSEYLLDY